MLKKSILLLLLLAPFSYAEQILVYGQGAVSAEPDMIELSLSVEERGKLASKIKTVIDHKTKQIIRIAEKHGVMAHDIQSMLVQLYPQYARRDSKERETKHLGFTAIRTIKITLRDIGQYDLVLDKMLRVGATHVNQVNYKLSNQHTLYRKALNIALRDATEKAADLIGQTNRKLGELTSVKEMNHYNAPMLEARVMADVSSPSVPGLMTVEAKIEAVFALQ